MIDGSPRWQIMRQQFPGTSTADCVEDAVQDFPSAVYGRASARLHHRDERFQVCPFGVAQVSVVRDPAGHRLISIRNRQTPNRPFQTRSEALEYQGKATQTGDVRIKRNVGSNAMEALGRKPFWISSQVPKSFM